VLGQERLAPELPGPGLVWLVPGLPEPGLPGRLVLVSLLL